MAGTSNGGKRAAETRRKNYTSEQISEINRRGGTAHSGGGFRWMREHDPERFWDIIAHRRPRGKAKPTS